MIRLNILELLEEQHHTKYWLFVQTGMSYRGYDRLIKNQTRSIRYDTIEKLCRILNCTPSRLFTIVPESEKTDET